MWPTPTIVLALFTILSEREALVVPKAGVRVGVTWPVGSNGLSPKCNLQTCPRAERTQGLAGHAC